MEGLHQEKHYSILQIALNLAAACLISGAIIGGTFYVTDPVAKQKAIMLNNQAMKSLVQDADTFTKVEGKEGWYKAEKSGKLIAYIVPAESKGYGGTIAMLVAITPEGKGIDFTITAANETPGLGDNAKKDSFRKQFQGKDPSKLEVVKDPSNHENIQAMTGATITSRAVTKGIKEAEEKVVALKGGQ